MDLLCAWLGPCGGTRREGSSRGAYVFLVVDEPRVLLSHSVFAGFLYVIACCCNLFSLLGSPSGGGPASICLCDQRLVGIRVASCGDPLCPLCRVLS